jgi:hypothetical protein
MLRADLSPKPVYEALMRLIHTEWHTKVAGKTDAEGKFEFRGFRGQYLVQIEVGGAKPTIKGIMQKEGPNEWDVSMAP